MQSDIVVTFLPTTFPSIHPTTFPSSSPTIHASSAPSTIPSSFPTIIPSTFPSIIPSTYPSIIPSTYPSVIPSTHPSIIPSTYPSTIPSTYPTNFPSSHPTRLFQFPSVQPSGEPSQSSSHPSIQPSVHISVQPLFSGAAVDEASDGEQSSQEQIAALSSTSPPPVSDFPGLSSDDSTTTDTDKGGNSALIGVIACVLAFTFLIASISVYRMKSRSKRKKKEVILKNSNLRGGRYPIYLDDDAPTIMVEVRKSATGGWHGFYGEDQLQSVDFSTTSEFKDITREEASPLYDGGLEEIESTNYNIGELDHLSDEDLVKAYHDAMAVDVESEDEVDFAMQGIGSPHSDKDHHEIT